jgi:hypothetical protein
MLWPHCMKMTGRGELNMYSPQMGQSQSMERSMHLWPVSMEMEMQAMHF